MHTYDNKLLPPIMYSKTADATFLLNSTTNSSVVVVCTGTYPAFVLWQHRCTAMSITPSNYFTMRGDVSPDSDHHPKTHIPFSDPKTLPAEHGTPRERLKFRFE